MIAEETVRKHGAHSQAADAPLVRLDCLTVESSCNKAIQICAHLHCWRHDHGGRLERACSRLGTLPGPKACLACCHRPQGKLSVAGLILKIQTFENSKFKKNQKIFDNPDSNHPHDSPTAINRSPATTPAPSAGEEASGAVTACPLRAQGAQLHADPYRIAYHTSAASQVTSPVTAAH